MNRRHGFYIFWILMILVLGGGLWFAFPLIPGAKEALQGLPELQDEPVMMISEPIQPIPLKIRLNADKVALGSRLFNEPRLSHDNTIACSTCHNLSKGGTDRLPRSIGINGAVGDVNSPTVFNSGFNFKQFWDGRADTLEDQAAGPTHNPKEMGSNWEEIVGKLKQDSSYVAAFSKIYKDGISGKNIQDAVSNFERSLYTPNARFDQYLRGKVDAINEKEKAGYRLFKDMGCIVCHQGVNVGGNMFQTFGKFGNYFEDRGNIAKADWGRFNVTGEERDRYKFKVPTLRNVELTPPYFHDGSAETLDEAARTMAQYQLGRALSDEEAASIIEFLKTLTGEYEGKPLK